MVLRAAQATPVVCKVYICPTEWHLPSDAEWYQLRDYFGGENHQAEGKLKEIGTTHWYSPNTGATNETGFIALPGGYRHYSGGTFFRSIGGYGLWWSTTENGAGVSWNWYMYYNLSDLYRLLSSKEVGYSVRCVRD